MAVAARIVGGIVAEVVELPPGGALEDCFHPDAGFVAATAMASPGMRYVDGAFLPPLEPDPPSEAELKATLIAYAADKRWRREVGGITVAGVPVATDDRAKLMITGARLAASADPAWSTVWHGADGLTYPVDAAAMVVISDAVQAHVNDGFATFATVRSEIEAGEITTMAEVDDAFTV